MTAPKRLIEEGTSFDRTLLRAAREERPSEDFERRVLAAASALPAARASTLVRPSLLARLARPRLLIVAALAGGATIFAASRSEHAASTPPASTATIPAAIEPSSPTEQPAPLVTVDSLPSVLSPVVAAPAPSPAPPTTNVKVASAAPSGASKSGAATPSGAFAASPPSPVASVAVAAEPRQEPVRVADADATEPTLHREVELLDAVKRSLRTGTPAEAERALAAYDAEFPRGILEPEAGFLRVRVLLAKGERTAAVALGDDLLRRHPNSVHAKRIRAALAADAGDKSPSSTLPR
jgi:hypothetical protein